MNNIIWHRVATPFINKFADAERAHHRSRHIPWRRRRRLNPVVSFASVFPRQNTCSRGETKEGLKTCSGRKTKTNSGRHGGAARWSRNKEIPRTPGNWDDAGGTGMTEFSRRDAARTQVFHGPGESKP